MEDKYCELNNDVYDLKVTLLKEHQAPFHENYKISKTIMKYLIRNLARFIHSKQDLDIYIYDEDIIDIDFDGLKYTNDKMHIEFGTNLIDINEGFIPAENYNPSIDYIVQLLNGSKQVRHIACDIRKCQEYIEQQELFDRIDRCMFNENVLHLKLSRRPTVTWNKDNK